jgi:predicted  nucleic acid-binding Zn-ribbon protein
MMLEPALRDDVAYLHRENERIKKTLHNHTAKLEDVVAHLSAVEEMIDGMRREIKENGKRELLTFQKRPLKPPDDEP